MKTQRNELKDGTVLSSRGIRIDEAETKLTNEKEKNIYSRCIYTHTPH